MMSERRSSIRLKCCRRVIFRDDEEQITLQIFLNSVSRIAMSKINRHITIPCLLQRDTFEEVMKKLPQINLLTISHSITVLFTPCAVFGDHRNNFLKLKGMSLQTSNLKC